MIKWIDAVLNRITTYRLVLYYLVGLLGVSIVYSTLGILPYQPLAVLFSALFLVAACWAVNRLFARTFQVAANIESSYISALILALIITPQSAPGDLWFFFWAGLWAMASKYILAISKQHIFNPIAFAVALTALTINQTASWWVGDGPMLPFVLLGGLLIIRKTQRLGLAVAFTAAALGTTFLLTAILGSEPMLAVQNIILYSPLVFFAVVIITEPLTMPPLRVQQLAYGALVGFLFSPEVHAGPVYLTPELAVLLGNLVAFIVNPRLRLILTLKEKIQLAPDVYDFIFVPDKELLYEPGQYLEWTLGHRGPDSRGNRRYFTLASSPTERNLRVGVKFYGQSSSYKRAMLAMPQNSQIVASQLAGDFLLPDDREQKCIFIAGGIGITPFRSMIQYLIDIGQRRPITLFYVNRSPADVVYQEVFDKAQRVLGLKTVYSYTDLSTAKFSNASLAGRIDGALIKKEVPDYGRCLFYISGPNAMVEATRELLLKIGVSRSHIKTDFFPGFA
jgi:ferredoxin-NADP reductase